MRPTRAHRFALSLALSAPRPPLWRPLSAPRPRPAPGASETRSSPGATCRRQPDRAQRAGLAPDRRRRRRSHPSPRSRPRLRPRPVSASASAFERAAASAVLPGPDPAAPHQPAIRESEDVKRSVTSRLGRGARDTLDNKCFYCTECAETFGQQCYMRQHSFEAKYADGVCLGLSFLWVRAAGWDGFVEALSSDEGRRVIAQIMDGRDRYREDKLSAQLRPLGWTSRTTSRTRWTWK